MVDGQHGGHGELGSLRPSHGWLEELGSLDGRWLVTCLMLGLVAQIGGWASTINSASSTRELEHLIRGSQSVKMMEGSHGWHPWNRWSGGCSNRGLAYSFGEQRLVVGSLNEREVVKLVAACSTSSKGGGVNGMGWLD